MHTSLYTHTNVHASKYMYPQVNMYTHAKVKEYMVYSARGLKCMDSYSYLYSSR